EQPIAAAADEVLVLPPRGARRDARQHVLLAGGDQLSPAGHAAGLLRAEAEVLHDEAELLAGAEGGGNPEHRERPLARAPPVEDLAAARQEDEALVLGPARQALAAPTVAARGRGERGVAGGPKPPCEPAEAGVAQEPRRRAVLVAVPGRLDQRAGAGRDQPPV